MLNLLRADLYRLKKSSVLLYTVLVGVAIIPMLIFILKHEIDNGVLNSPEGISATMDIFGVSLVGLSKVPGAIDVAFRAAGKGDFIPLVIGIFVCIYTTNEFSFGTVKNILAVGNKKASFYFSKLITISLSTAVIFLSIVLAAFAVGFIFFGFGSEISGAAQLLQTLALQLLLHIAYAAIFFMIAALIKNTGVSIAVSIGTLIFDRMLFEAADLLFKTGTSIQSFCMGANIRALTVPSPTFDMIAKALLVGSVFLIIPTIAGSLILSRQDVN